MTANFNRGFPLQPFSGLVGGAPFGNIPPPPPPVNFNFGPWCFAGVEVDTNLFGGSEVDTNTYGGTEADTNFYGGTETDTNAGLGGSETETNLYGGTEADTNAYGGTQSDANSGLGGSQYSGCFVTMQAVNITLGEFNDETIDLSITNNSSAFNLNGGSGYNLQVLLKVNVGDQDTAPTTKTYSSQGGSPAITINAGAGGTAILVIPHTDLESTAFTFWRCDVVNSSSQQATAMYGTVTVKAL